MLEKKLRDHLSEIAEEAWDRLVQLCIKEEASFLVLAGDVFHDAAASVRAQTRLYEGLERLIDNDVRVFICHGNHDPLNKDRRPIGDLPRGVERFEPGEPQSFPVELRSSGDLVQVSGVSYGHREEDKNLALDFHRVNRRSGTVAHIAVLHANVGPLGGHKNYSPCTREDLAATSTVDYWALGHIHKRTPLRLPNGSRAEYCGNLQGRSFKPAECEPKGALVVPIEDGRVGEPRLEHCDTVRFVRSEVFVEPQDSVTTVRAKIKEEASKLGARNSGRAVAWKMLLTGSNRDPAQLREDFREGTVPDGMARELSERLNDGGLCDVAFSVRPDERERILAEGDLRAEVLEALKEFSTATGTDDSVVRGTNALLLDGLPTPGLKREWQQMLDESSEFMDEVIALAEQLLWDTFANAPGEVW